MEPDPAQFLANLFLAHKGANRVKVQRKLGIIIVRKIDNFFWFIDDLHSLNDVSTFDKHYKNIYQTELELKKENNINSCVFTFTLKMENSILNYLTSKITLASTL